MKFFIKKKKRVYLDNAAAAPVSSCAREEFARLMNVYGNPSAPYQEGVEAREELERARTRIARLAGVKSQAIVITSGATEANNLAIQGYMKAKKMSRNEISEGKTHVLYLPTCHASVIESIQALSSLGVSVEELVSKEGVIDVQKLKSQIRDETVLISMDAVCGETGTRHDTRAVANVLRSLRRQDIALHVDASQLPLVESIQMERLSADLLTLDAQKIGGVRGVGALIVRGGVSLAPMLYGGGQEGGLRAGTEPVALVGAFAGALWECGEGREVFYARAQRARKTLIDSICNSVSDTHINVGKQYVPHIVNFSFIGRDTDYLVMLLDAKGFSVSTKSACESQETGSRVVLSLTNEPLRAASTLRVSWGPQTSDRELKEFAKTLVATISFLDTLEYV